MASGTRGYRSYSGRGNKGKIFLAILLGLVIVGAAAFLLLQSHVYYDANGRPHLRLPEKPRQEQTISPDEVDLIFEISDELPQDESFTRYHSAFSVTEATLAEGVEAIDAVWAKGMEDHDAVAVTLKDNTGHVWFSAAAAIPGSVKASAEVAEAVERIASSDVYTIARINALHDPLTAKQWVTDMGLRNLEGYIFFDGNNSQWLDAAKPRTRQKLCELVQQAAQLGFDEILLTELTYPTMGNLENVKDGGVDRSETLRTLLKEIRAVLPEGVKLSLELPAETIQNGGNEVAGHVLADLVPLLDTVYTVTEEDQAPALRDAVQAVSEECGLIAEVTAVDRMTSRYLLLN